MFKSRRMRWAGHARHVGRRGIAYGFPVGTPEGKRLLGRLVRCAKDDIKMDRREIKWGDLDWIKLC
jgi:hypothetical protein